MGRPQRATQETSIGEADARRVLMARAFEEEDRDGLILAPAERKKAGRKAAPESGAEAERADLGLAAVQRARELYALLEERSAAVHDVFRLAGAGRFLWPVVAPLAFLVGFMAHQLGPAKQVNILSVPLLGLLAWNLAVYAVLPFLSRLRLRRPNAPGFLARLVAWFGSPERVWIRKSPAGAERRVVTAALRRFLSDWLRIGAPLHLARATLALHLGSLMLAAGAVAGMYLRGIAFEYQATWESTFLGSKGLHALLSVVLAPAIAVTGESIPGPDALADMRSTPGAAAPWIHLYAVTVALVIGVPRLLLAIASALRVRKLVHDLPLPLDEDASFMRSLSAARGEGMRVTAIPYSLDLPPAGAGVLLAFLGDLLGARARVDIRKSLTYGEDPPALDGAGPECAVVVFNLAQPPEEEVHGRFVEALSSARAAAKSPAPLLVLVDESSLRRTLGVGAATEERIAQRRKAWEAALEDTGVPVVALDLSRPAGNPVLESARKALAPRARGRSRS